MPTTYYMKPSTVKGTYVIYHPTGKEVACVPSREAAKSELRKWQTGVRKVEMAGAK